MPFTAETRGILPTIAVAALAACASAPHVTRVQPLAESAEIPYQNVLVIALFSSFDSRRYLEDEIVMQLAERGTHAVASTSRMNTRTPVIRETFVQMVEDIDADAVLLIQLSSLRSEGSLVDMNPRQSVNVRPTGYWNVFSVETTEYVEPQAVEFEHSLVLLTEVFSATTQQAVWGIQSKSHYSVAFDEMKDYSIIRDEAESIVRYLSRDGLIAN